MPRGVKRPRQEMEMEMEAEPEKSGGQEQQALERRTRKERI